MGWGVPQANLDTCARDGGSILDRRIETDHRKFIKLLMQN